MLRLMLDSHPDLAIGPETSFVLDSVEASRGPGEDSERASRAAEAITSHRRFPDFGLDPSEVRRGIEALDPFSPADAVRVFYRAYAARHGKPRWGDKTPGYGLRMRAISRILPEARFIHLIRDGRDVRLSQLGSGADLPTAAKHARRWKQRVMKTRRQGAHVAHYMEVRFEDLVVDPERELRRICEFADLPWDAEMLSFHERAADRLAEIDRDLDAGEELGRRRSPLDAGSRVVKHRLTTEPPRHDRIGGWRTKMSEPDRAEFERVAGALLADLGYEVSAPPAPAETGRGEARRRRREARLNPPAPFVVGAAGSGTTMLRLMLDAHPELAIPPETHFLPRLFAAARADGATPESVAGALAAERRWGDFGVDAGELTERLAQLPVLTPSGAARCFYRAYAAKHEKPRWGDKTPRYVLNMARIARVLPEARFVHLIRDGRDVRLSRLNRTDSPPPPEVSARRWRRRIERGRRQAARLDDGAYLEVRFEDLVADPEAELRRICRLCDLDWDPAMLAYHHRAPERMREMAAELPTAGSRQRRPGERLQRKANSMRAPDAALVGAWRTEMAAGELEAYEREAGSLLAALGYEPAAAAADRR